MRALIAEDDATSREQLKAFLSGYAELSYAEDGEAALSAFKDAFAEGKPFQLICLDIMMPEMDGHSVLKGVRSFEEEQGTPASELTRVIMTTALDDSNNVLGAFKAGCEGYVVKPIEKLKLIHELKKLGLI